MEDFMQFNFFILFDDYIYERDGQHGLSVWFWSLMSEYMQVSFKKTAI